MKWQRGAGIGGVFCKMCGERVNEAKFFLCLPCCQPTGNGQVLVVVLFSLKEAGQASLGRNV